MAVRQARVHGRKVWLARVQLDGRRVSRVCRTFAEARAAEADLHGALREAITAEQEKASRPATLREAFEGYVENLAARGKPPASVYRAAQTARVVEAVLPEMLDRPVAQFTDEAVFAFRLARERAGIKPATTNRDLRVIRAMLKRLIPSYRFPQDAFSPEDETRVRWLRPAEERTLLGTMPSPFKEMAALAKLTLMRLSEIRLLRRQDVHLEQGVVLLPRAKAGARPVVLNTEAQDLLWAQLARHDGELVFPNPDGRPYSRVHIGRVFRKAARGAGLRDFRFHDLRHHGATMALNAGFTAPIVMALGGWKSERMMRRYAAVTDETLRRAAEAVSGNGHGPAARNGHNGGASRHRRRRPKR